MFSEIKIFFPFYSDKIFFFLAQYLFSFRKKIVLQGEKFLRSEKNCFAIILRKQFLAFEIISLVTLKILITSR